MKPAVCLWYWKISCIKASEEILKIYNPVVTFPLEGNNFLAQGQNDSQAPVPSASDAAVEHEYGKTVGHLVMSDGLSTARLAK